MQIAIEFPDSYVTYYSQSLLREEILLNNALMLYKHGKVSIAKAAKLANQNLYDFIKECKKNAIPVIDLTKDELLAELSYPFLM